jgi:phage FluMu protein Com
MEKRRAGMLIKICCPVCGKRLFEADVSASGMISAYCKRCKVERLIELKGKT